MSQIAEQPGGWSNTNLGEVTHELIHAHDALGSLRVMLGIPAGAKTPTQTLHLTGGPQNSHTRHPFQ